MIGKRRLILGRKNGQGVGMKSSPPLMPSQIETWVFDLDNTLYPAAHSLFPQIDTRIRAYIANHLSLDLDEAYRLQKHYYREYGTTLRGLMSLHDVNPHEFLLYVHDIDHSVLDPSPRLGAALMALPGRKLVFTNGSTAHAEQVLKRLDISEHFEGIFDIVDADFIPKPDMRPYQMLGQRFDVRFNHAAMIEDLERNLVPAASLGMATVWIKQDEHPDRKFLDTPSQNPSHVHHITGDLILWLEQMVDSDPRLKPSCA